MFILGTRPPLAALTLAFCFVSLPAHRGYAQSDGAGVPRLPETVVTATRLGDGITGTSTTIITAEEIERSTAATLPELLARQPGIQVQTLFGGGTGTRNAVDMRGFGAASTSNTLVLINGRRVNDVDLSGVDFSTIPRDSIARIEITRGNSGSVLYGDGAVGGTINIVTKAGPGAKPGYRVDGGMGTFDYHEGSASAIQSFGQATAAFHANAVNSGNYRANNATRQRNAVADIRYRLDSGSVYLNLSADNQYLGLPGGRLVTLTSSELITNRSGAATPRDFAEREGINATLGGTRMFGDNMELVLDGGLRHKKQHTETFSASGSSFDAAADTTLRTLSLTPRLNIEHRLFGVPSKTVTGIDLYHSTYDADSRLHSGDIPRNTFDVSQLALGVYIQENAAIRPDTDLSGGIRFSSVDASVKNRPNTGAPGGSGISQGTPFDRTEEHYTAHLGLDHRLTERFALFGRIGRSLRVPTVDERTSLFDTQPILTLRSQTSNDAEAGFRFNLGGLDLQSSAYVMKLKNELHFNSVTFANVNLEPTRREGVETLARYRISDTLRIKGGFAYTDAEFRSGAFKDKQIPLVSRWTGSGGIGWDIVPKMAALDLDVRYSGERRLDNDQRNTQPMIPDFAVVDLRIGGDVDRFRWSLAVLNLFDSDYFDYGIASSSVFGRYNAYPQPGRSFLAKLGADF